MKRFVFNRVFVFSCFVSFFRLARLFLTSSGQSVANFEYYWQIELQANPENPSLLKTIVVSQHRQLLFSACLFLVTTALSFVPSVLLLQIFQFLGDPYRPLWHGILLSIGLFAAKMLEGLSGTFSFFFFFFFVLFFTFSFARFVACCCLMKD
jgi:hypothetical protein